MAEPVGNFNFKNMSVALKTCSSLHEKDSMPYYKCLCSGLQNVLFIRAKYYYCKQAARLEAEASAEAMAEIGITIGVVLASLFLLTVLIILFIKSTPRLRTALAHCGLKQRMDACTRMFCVCCQKHPTHKLGEEPPANTNLSGRPTSHCGRCCYSQAFLATMEFFCDCDCFRTRRAPKYIMPILGKAKSKPRTESSGSEASDGVELQQPRRMRSVRRAPPPPRQQPFQLTSLNMPDAPHFDPDHEQSTKHGTFGKRRAPGPPPGAYAASRHQRPPLHDTACQPLQERPPQYLDLFQPQPPSSKPQPPPNKPQAPASAPPPPPPHEQKQFVRDSAPRISKEFTAQLHQAMAVRRAPSESDI